MNPPSAGTEVPAEASPVPPLMYWSLWLSVFCVLAWGFQVLLGRFGGDPPDPP